MASEQRSAWVIRAGARRNNHAAEFLEAGVVVLGFEPAGDLSRMTLEEIRTVVEEGWPNEPPGAQIAFSSQLNLFANKVRPGDIVITPLGPGEERVHLGIIEGPYEHPVEPVIGNWHHSRRTRWLRTVRNDQLPASTQGPLQASRTITRIKDVTAMEQMVDSEELLGRAQEPITWWVNQGATYLHERDGGYLWAPQRSAKDGGARPHWQAMTEVRPGDRIVHYRDKAIRAVSRATSEAEDTARPSELPSEAWGQEGWLVRTQMSEFAEPLQLDEIAQEIRVAGSGPFDVNGGVKQGYLFRLSDAQGTKLAELIHGRQVHEAVATPNREPETTVPDELIRWTYLPGSELEELIELLQARRQLILQGPPGSGKTWVAEALARYLTGNPLEGDTNSRLELVQFHQSYGYEDFMQGIRPVTVDGRLEYQLLPGILMRFVSQPSWDDSLDYVLLIDEINRANISRVFGELLLLLEYRQKKVRLPISGTDDPLFELPRNLLIIGTMNTADRSLASIDYALRRRFAFHRLSPVEHGDAPVLRRWLDAQTGISSTQRGEVLRLFIELNRRVEDEMGAGGEDFQIGHSYFMTQQVFTPAGQARIWRTSIRPLLEEYFANRKQREELLDQLEPQALLAPRQVAGSSDETIEEDAE